MTWGSESRLRLRVRVCNAVVPGRRRPWAATAEAPKLGRIRVTMQPRPWAWPEGGGAGGARDGQKVLRGRCGVRPRLGRPGTYNRAPGRWHGWLTREPVAASVWSPGWDAARQGSSLGWAGAGAGRRGRPWGLWGAGAGPSHAACSRGRHAVPRVPLTPPRAGGSSDQRSSDCAAVLLTLHIHGNHVCGAVSAPQVLQEGASRLPHWPTGALSGWRTSLPHLDLNPDRQAALEPGLSAQGPAPPRPGQIGRMGRCSQSGRRAGGGAGGPLAGAPGGQWPLDRGQSLRGSCRLVEREGLLFSSVVWRPWSDGDAAVAAAPTWEGQSPGATVACRGLGGRQAEPSHPGLRPAPGRLGRPLLRRVLVFSAATPECPVLGRIFQLMPSPGSPVPAPRLGHHLP